MDTLPHTIRVTNDITAEITLTTDPLHGIRVNRMVPLDGIRVNSTVPLDGIRAEGTIQGQGMVRPRDGHRGLLGVVGVRLLALDWPPRVGWRLP
ncbi:MAG: hypothetical protein M1813_008490 [Trichoglossum hirsutum]|nr:MAG: hypothetical protein M1813_008490 [Trichoglossum hirsutum]